MGKFDAFAATALSLIKAKGKQTSVRRPGSGLVDPVAQTRSGDDTTISAYVVGMPPGRSAEFRVGSLANRKAVEFYIAQKDLAFTVANGDEVYWSSKWHKLFWSATYDPANDGAILTLAYGEAA